MLIHIFMHAETPVALHRKKLLKLRKIRKLDFICPLSIHYLTYAAVC